LGAPLSGLSEDDLEAAVVEAAALESQAAAIKLRLASEAERRHLEARAADVGIEACLARLTGERTEQLKGGLRLARLLRDRYGHTLRALAAGELRTEQALVIVNGLEVTAEEVPEGLREQAEELLVGKATGVGRRSGTRMPVPQLRRAVRRAYAGLDTDVHRVHLKRTLKRTERRARSNTWLEIHDNGDGTWSGKFTVPELHGSLVKAALENLSSPRRYGRDKTGNEVTDPTGSGGEWCLGYYDWLGRAFCELIEHLPVDALPRSAISMLVTLDHTVLTGDLEAAGIATTDTGVDLSAGEARRLACTAGLVPAVLGSDSLPLDLGRTRRLFTTKQRQALALRHDTCAIAGCQRPFAWCEIHHLTPWGEGGRTDLANALPLCWPHHRYAEDPDYTLVRHDDTEWRFKRRPVPLPRPNGQWSYAPART
jgi:hypothetical protein